MLDTKVAKSKMTLSKLAVILLSICVCGPANADTAGRIAKILTKVTFSGGELDSQQVATVEGCVVRLSLERNTECKHGGNFQRTETLIDLRILNTKSEQTKIRDLSGTIYNELGATITYTYRWHYRPLLKSAEDTSNRIRKEETRKYPERVLARLQSLSKRYHEEINPSQYGQSMRTTFFCSGTEIANPLPSHSFRIHILPEQTSEFVQLVEDYARRCELEAAS